MKSRKYSKSLPAGFLAGMVNGLLGSGGGMILVPMLSRCREYKSEEVFSTSVVVMLCQSLVTLAGSGQWQILKYSLLPFYIAGSCIGGILAGKKPVSAKWLHRIFGVMIIVGGIRSLCF